MLLLAWLWGGRDAGGGRHLVRFAPGPCIPSLSEQARLYHILRAMATPPRRKECDPWSLALENRESFEFCHKSAVTSAVHLSLSYILRQMEMLTFVLTSSCCWYEDQIKKQNRSWEQKICLNVYFYYFSNILFICPLRTALGLRCCPWAFSGCGKWGLLSVAVRGLLI